jgi:hypothetical protein
VIVMIESEAGESAATFDIDVKKVPPTLAKASWIRLEGVVKSGDQQKDPICPAMMTSHLPIYGVTDIGNELRPAGKNAAQNAGLLLDGTVDIFVRTIELKAFGEKAPRIYPASTTGITLPPGARIMEYVTPGQERLPWTGFVMAGDSGALSIKVNTPAARLAIIRPGVGLEPEVLSIGFFTQLSNDPTLVSLQVAAACFFAVFQMLGATLGAFARRSGNASAATVSYRGGIASNDVKASADEGR